MPLGAARGIIGRQKAAQFTLIEAVTPTTNASNTLAVLLSNTGSWSTGDFLFTFSGGVHGGTTRTAATPAPSGWTPGSETWTSLFDARAIVSTSAISFNGFTATALSTETTKAATLGFSGTMFSLMSGLFVCAGSTIVRQVTPVSKVEGTGTSVTATFGAAVLTTSQVISFVMQRSSSTFAAPTNFTSRLAQALSTNGYAVVSARIGHDSTDVTTTGLTSASAAKEAVAIELARPGQTI